MLCSSFAERESALKQLPLALSLFLGAPPVFAQDEPKITSLQAHALNDNVFWVEGGTANAGFVVGTDGVLVVDSQRTSPDGALQIALIATITQKAIIALVITHADPDHVGGIPAYPADVEVIMQENARAQIIAGAADEHGGPLFGPTYKALAAYHLPDHTVASVQRMTLAGVPVELIHTAPAHTSGDLVVYLPRQKVIFGGDIVLTNQGRFPVIHLGGSSLGWIASMKAILALDSDMIVPGHGPIEPRAKLETRLKDVEERRAAIKTMIEAGKSFEDINTVLPAEVADPRFPSFNRTTYDELVKGYPEQVAPWASLAKQP
jgi:glyoxylase-like metal-dependent hydrolase (beta-lactamase superfamily II)